jgi:hypothetical protein
MKDLSSIKPEKPNREIFYPITCMLLSTAPWFIIYFLPQYLDAKYKEIGFCQSTKIRQGYDSFEICFWVDLLGSILLYLLVIILGNRISSSDRSEIISHVPATIMHGLLHYYQYLNQGRFFSNGQNSMKLFTEGPWYLFVGNFAFILGFQFNLQQGVGNYKSLIGASLAINLFQVLFVPHIYSLTYVNSWIFITDILVKYNKPMTRKEDWGDSLSKIIIFILLLEPIIEATKCENGLENLGGHALFDSWIVFFEFFSLGLAYYRERNKEKTKSEKQS